MNWFACYLAVTLGMTRNIRHDIVSHAYCNGTVICVLSLL